MAGTPGKKKAERARVPRKDRRGANPVLVGAIALIAVLIGSYFGFSKHVPFKKGFRIEAVFQSANSIRPGSPVRIAGVNIGKVKEVRRFDGGDGNAAVVTMQINKAGLPIHKDATAKIRPRIFLEGNFFVDVQPGTPSAPALGAGDTIPVTQTSTPVQLDQLLTALQSDTREDLQKTLEGYGTALTYQPTTAEDASQDPSARGQTAAESVNDSIKTAGPALRGAAIVNEAFLGLQRDDLSGLVAGTAKVMGGLGRNTATLQDLVVNFNTTMASFASRESDLKRSIALLGPTVENADNALRNLGLALPNTSAFAKEILPGVRETPATIDATLPWIKQAKALMGSDELGGVATQLRPTTVNLAKLASGSVEALKQGDLVSRCVVNTVLPAGNVKITDDQFTSGVENYKEFWWGLVGLAGEGQNFDGNGQYVRLGVGGGDLSVPMGRSSAGFGENTGEALSTKVDDPPLGTRPAMPKALPPFNSNAPCKDQKVPDLNGAKSGPADGGGTLTEAPALATPPPTPVATAASARTASTKGAGK